MVSLIEFKSNKGNFYIEVGDSVRTGDQTLVAKDGGVVVQATKSLEETLTPVTNAMATIFTAVADSKVSPSELEIEFGLKLSADAGVIIAKTSGEASITITASWKKA